MTEKQISEFIEQNLQNNPLLDETSGLAAIEKISEIADSYRINWALVGGFAMYLYGSPRLTKDIDIIASENLPLNSIGKLRSGGERYSIVVEKRKVDVDWIVRSDDAKRFYREALNDAVKTKQGLPIISPEWLVILKYIAGRFKDQDDAIYLLRKKGLVNRKLIKENIIKVAGKDAWVSSSAGYFRLFDLADGVSRSDGDENESYRRL
jgi:hypothetical protein